MISYVILVEKVNIFKIFPCSRKICYGQVELRRTKEQNQETEGRGKGKNG